jgi:hypothetical protein
MRATILLFLFLLSLASFFWVTTEGVFLILGFILILALLVITVAYADSMLLFLLGARELISSDEKTFFQAASQEAYKLAVPMPRLYFYNGYIDRAFVFHSHNRISIVLNKSLLESATIEEFEAVCFELLLQVKKGMAPKRTKSMLLIGFIAWISHSLAGLIMNIIPIKDVKITIDWFVGYLINPVLEALFRAIMGTDYFKKLDQYISEHPYEKQLLQHFGLKLRKPYPYYSLPSRKMLELYSVNKSRHLHNIMTMEFLPHEWDYLFKTSELTSA